MSMNYIDLFFLACKVRFLHLRQFVYTLFHYYLFHPRFFLADTLLLSQYFLQSPFRLIRLHDERHPKHPLGPYGETDFQTLSTLFDTFAIPPSASIADLGSGRGRASFFLKLVRGHTTVHGIEYYRLMVTRAERVRRWLHIEGLTFTVGDWTTSPLDEVDVIYLYGLVPDERAWKNLATHLSSLKPGTRIITISSWLGEALPNRFHLEQQTTIQFDWGTTDAYLQTVVTGITLP